ncbi:homoserine O-succinyltransferase [Lachnospiraceae bacterium RM5]|nr:homoserine O-succinyltransferase [Lachnospiraceae bacterium RM5]
MPIKVQSDLPAKAVIESENIFIMDENRAISQDIRPLKIALLNLMPLKNETEIQLLRALSNTPLQVDLTFVCTGSHVSKNTPASHLNQFYTTFDKIKDKKFDGFIITGAPLEEYKFEEVDYWEELKEIMEFTKTNVTSTFHICWGAQAGLYYHYGIKKIERKKKLFGIYKQEVLHHKTPLMRGFDDYFWCPLSRNADSDADAIERDERLVVLAKSKEAGPTIISDKEGKQIFVTGHMEYDRITLDVEYKRDLAKGLAIDIPENYYPDDDPRNKPSLSWRAHANTLYTNWLNYYVYQITPYIL